MTTWTMQTFHVKIVYETHVKMGSHYERENIDAPVKETWDWHQDNESIITVPLFATYFSLLSFVLVF